jgi:hypothetical protein
MGHLTEGDQPQMPTGSETIHFIHHSKLPKGRCTTYLKIVANYIAHTKPKNNASVLPGCGGNIIDYKDKVKLMEEDLNWSRYFPTAPSPPLEHILKPTYRVTLCYTWYLTSCDTWS